MNEPKPGGQRNAKIITFYSYKGGTGRSMAVANIAWILANSGFRVLTIDWDLEAPGLHRYFEPFLQDKKLERTTGLIDFTMQFAAAAVSGRYEKDDTSWFQNYSNLLANAIPVEFEFPNGGVLDLVPAGRQDASYSNRVNSFNWQNFYEVLGGGVLLEAAKQKLRGVYDYILIDSRTGVSDTSGICTVQMPDEIVVCFTLNRQGIYGAAAAAASAQQQRTTSDGIPKLKIWPVPMRVEQSEKDRLEVAHTLARTNFSPLMQHLDPVQLDRYWGEISVAYEPYYAYEEVLAAFKDRPRQSNSLLSNILLIAQRLCGEQTVSFKPIDEVKRAEGLTAFTARSAWSLVDEFQLLGTEYEWIRRSMRPGDERTELMSQLLGRVKIIQGGRDSGEVAEYLFAQKTDGGRVIGLALARCQPQRQHISMAIDGVSASRSAFEQYHALLLLSELMNLVDASTMPEIQSALMRQISQTLSKGDSSRRSVAKRLLDATLSYSPTEIPGVRNRKSVTVSVNNNVVELSEVTPARRSVRYNDPIESHGRFLVTRNVHSISLPAVFRISRYLVTNRLYAEFVRTGGYHNETFWAVPSQLRGQFVTADKVTLGPGGWLDESTFSPDKAEWPVKQICFMEASAFVRWLNAEWPAGPGWRWAIPHEDVWEYAARGDEGFIYPWGDIYQSGKCNSLESGIAHETAVSSFEAALSPYGCADMAGNLWEFVTPHDGESTFCTLRGGSYTNNSSEIRNYLRLIRVPPLHRAPDFGMRLAQVEERGGEIASEIGLR